MSRNVGRIWQPVIEPTESMVPLPTTNPEANQSGLVFTKTSLTHSNSLNQQDLHNTIKQYNREVLQSSQSFNNSPKPFVRAGSASVSIEHQQQYHPGNQNSFASPLVTAPSTSIQQQPVKICSQLSQVAQGSGQTDNPRPQFQRSASANQPQPQQEENMAPKLIHKQYNTPIDLYSMNNIRKTIEAHTELIAPGLKGINFMKPETPVNKQSEVYKLVMEEEHGQQAGRSARLSPISGQPISLATAITQQEKSSTPKQNQSQVLNYQEEQHSRVSQQQQQQHLRQQHQQQHQHQCVQRQDERKATTTRVSPKGPGLVSQPKCCECGQFIVGSFARIQGRCIHPQCFNCTTCGTSLKNIGYFTVNDKLYCEIHAKQVANMMRINYDFNNSEPTSRIHDSKAEEQHQLNQQERHQQQQQQHQPVTSTTGEFDGSYKQYLKPNPTATISTMFSNRSASVSGTSQLQQHDRAQASTSGSEVRWTWRPMTSKERADSSTNTSTSQTNLSSIGSSQFNKSMEQQQQQQHHEEHHHSQQQQMTFGQQPIGVRGRGLLQAEGSLIGGRIPICLNCNVQIHGPYILAGKTTWCKGCSQSHFNCSSCKRSLLNIGFIEDNQHKFYCEHCFEAYHAPTCSRCNIRIKGDCLNALQKQWHPSCFVCGHCRRPFGNSSFYLEDNVPYCERDWNTLFTTKCYSCSLPIQAGDKWIEALDRNYHSNCFRCTSCHSNLEGSTFYCKNGKPYCRLHAR